MREFIHENKNEMYKLTVLLSLNGYSYEIEEHPFLQNGLRIDSIQNETTGEKIPGNFICGNSINNIEAGFGFGIKEHTENDVLDGLNAEEALNLVMGSYWKE